MHVVAPHRFLPALLAALLATAGASAVARPPTTTPAPITTDEGEDDAWLQGLDPAVYARALAAFAAVRAEGHTRRPVLAIIDYARPSTERRLWVFDIDTQTLLHHALVAHGSGTGALMATSFSNRHGSHQSSLGTFVVGDAYQGKHGRSLRLHGLEPGLNDQALARAVVIHAAAYVSDDVVARQGRLGRSWGCPALDPAVADAVMDTLEDGAVLIAWHDDPRLLAGSRYLGSPRVAAR